VPVLKNPKHEKFAQLIARGEYQHKAYLQAGYSGNEGKASRLGHDPRIVARVLELKDRGAERAEVTIESLILEAAEIQSRAIEAGQFAAATSALTAKAKLAGKWIERSEQGKPGDFDRMNEEELEAYIAERFASARGGNAGARTQAGQTGVRGKPGGLH
jgi:phage terminase small subunit